MVFTRSGGSIARRRAEWSARVERFKASGLPVGVFAAQEGVRAGTLSWWRRQFSSTPVASKALRPTAALSFVRLEPASPSVSPLEIIIAAGRTIRVPIGFDEDTLSRVVVVLERGVA